MLLVCPYFCIFMGVWLHWAKSCKGNESELHSIDLTVERATGHCSILGFQSWCTTISSCFSRSLAFFISYEFCLGRTNPPAAWPDTDCDLCLYVSSLISIQMISGNSFPLDVEVSRLLTEVFKP